MDNEETEFGELSELRSSSKRGTARKVQSAACRGRSGRRHTLAMVG